MPDDLATVTSETTAVTTDWKQILVLMRRKVGENDFNAWLGRLELDDVTDAVAHLSVPTDFLRSWICKYYLARIAEIFKSEMPHIAQISICVRSAARVPVTKGIVTPAPHKPAPVFRDTRPTKMSGATALRAPTAPASLGSTLNNDFTFETFIAGPSNTIARAAALNVAEEGELLFNPLYVHAGKSLGKTHLLQAIAHTASARGLNILYYAAEKFMYDFVSAVRSSNVIQFNGALLAADILIIDDMQFLRGENITSEFRQILCKRMINGRGVVIAADRPPYELENLDEEVRLRLSSGLVVQLDTFETDLRKRILEMRIEKARVFNPTFEVSPEVIDFLAKTITTNGHDLDGAVNRLLSHTTLTGAPLTIETAERAINDLLRPHNPKRVRIEDIQKLVAIHYTTDFQDIISARRHATVVRPRQIAMYLSKIITGRSLPEIGRRFGGRDHTTVLHAVRKIEALAQKDASLKEELNLLECMLYR
ncbi:MAG: chromosomal replication initiator protein DnaA [Candidatus Kaiserbacteria bacterium]|nr:chromosomal replication initiator protein DnaA [Candidatus Kaiserbacteria bacterium]